MISTYWTIHILSVFILETLCISAAPSLQVNSKQNATSIEEVNLKNGKTRNGVVDRVNVFPVSEHEDFIVRHFDTAEYTPRMEILAVGFQYSNETATLRVTVHVGVPSISSSEALKNRTVPINENNVTPDVVEKFTSYEVYLSAISDDDISKPPPSCSSDLFLQHSYRDISVGCPLSSGRVSDARVTVSEVPISANSNVASPWVASCIEEEAKNFTVEFRHVYSAYYCLLIQPQVDTHTRRTFARMAHFRTNITPSDITKWQTTIDLQPMPRNQRITAAFTLPDPSFQILSHQLRVDLLQVSGHFCNDTNQIRLMWTKIIPMEQGKQAADVEFSGKPPGLYCVVVVPLDERCDGNNYWKSKGGSCARHSAKSVNLQALSAIQEKNVLNKPVIVVRSPTLDIWNTFMILCAFICGLALIVVLSAIFVYRRRRKSRPQHRQHRIFLKWRPSAAISSIETSIPDVINVKQLSNVIEKNHVVVSDSKEKTALLTPVSNSILLLYRRDDPHTSRRASELRKQLQCDCDDRFKIYDFGDESQWEDIAVEGLDWLPNRIFGNPKLPNSIKRVIVIHSPLQVDTADGKMEEKEDDQINKENTVPLLTHDNCDSIVNAKDMLKSKSEETFDNCLRPTTDQDFLYGMQLLQSYMRETVEGPNSDHSSIYRRVFNVRYSDIGDWPSSGIENQNLGVVYPTLQVAPFTCYLLPKHYKELLQHLTGPQ